MDSILSGYEYLRPPVEVNLVQHDSNYIKSGSKDSAQRKIFYAVPLDEFETSKIQELESNLARRGVRLPPGWNERETLRYIYGAKFNMDTAATSIQASLKWRGSRDNTIIPDAATNLLESGAIYTYGRDSLFRPIVIIDFGKLNTENLDVENFQIALITLLDILKEYCFVPGRVENWIVILDTRKIHFANFPSKQLSQLKTLLSACYPLTLERLIIVNSSPSILSNWKNIEGLLDPTTAKKIVILEPSQIARIQQIIPKNQLENKFGGTLPDLTKFWIPRVPFSNFSPSKSNTNLEGSLARLSQQIENVEGKFHRMLSPDGKYRGSQNGSPYTQSQTPFVLQSNSSPLRTSGYPESRQYTPTTTYNYQPIQRPEERNGWEEKEKKAAPKDYLREYEQQQQQRVQPVVYNVDSRYERNSNYRDYEPEGPKRSYQPQQYTTPDEQRNQGDQQEEPETEESTAYDFNDPTLVDLIMGENDALMSGKLEVKPIAKQNTQSQAQEAPKKSSYNNNPNNNDVNRQEVFKSINRSSTGNRPQTLSEYTAQPDRRTYVPDVIITRHAPLNEGDNNVKKSLPYYTPQGPGTTANGNYTTTTTTYVTRNEYSSSNQQQPQSNFVTREYSSQPQPKVVQGRLEYEIAKSNLPVDQVEKDYRNSRPVNGGTGTGTGGGYSQPGYASTMRSSQTPSEKPVEEWQYQKYAKKKEVKEEQDEYDGKPNFCGLCVSTRKKEKTAAKA